MKKYIAPSPPGIQEALKYEQLTCRGRLSLLHRLVAKNRVMKAFAMRLDRPPSFPVDVDLSLSVEEMIRQGNYDRTSVDAHGIAHAFPVDRSGPSRYSKNLRLIPPAKEGISLLQWLEELSVGGWKPECVPELLAFGKTWPNVQKKFHILALGEMDKTIGGRTRIAALTGHPGIRRIELLHDRGSDIWIPLDLALVSRV